MRDFPILEVTVDGVGDLLLKLAQVLALRGDASTTRRIPGGDQHAVVQLNLKKNLVYFAISCCSADADTSR